MNNLFTPIWTSELWKPVWGDAISIWPNDLAAMQRLFSNGENGGYWPADPAYAFEDSAGTTLASVNGVVGYRTDVALGKHAVQATTANKPYLRLTPTTTKPWYDSNTATGALNVTFASALGSACTIATVTPEGVSILENQTVGATYNICPPYGYNSDVLIINRALTAVEKELVTRVFQRSMPKLGSELVTNGIFETTTDGWTAYNSTLASVNSQLVTTATDIAPRASQSIGTSAGYFIRVSFQFVAETVTGNSFFTAGASPSTANILNQNIGSSLGTYKYYIKATSSATTLAFTGSSGTLVGQTQTWDNITARHVL